MLDTLDMIKKTPGLGARDALRSTGDFKLRACHPINEGRGAAFWKEGLSTPLSAAFGHLEERTDIALSGVFKDGHWLARSGHVAGVFAAPLFGIPPTGRVAFVRFGRFDRFEGDELAETILLLDLPALMMQSGVWPLSPPMGDLLIAPSPATHDGVANAAGPVEGAKSLALVEAMIGGLHVFDGSLKSMGMRNYWTEDFWWFGPAPIGNFCGHPSYEHGHQGPFLTAFPDRVGGNHAARIGERNYVASTGWPSITATHSGGGWLGLAPTGRQVTMRVMDFWRREGELLAENWVMIDIPDLLLQMGIDVFERMNALLPKRRT
ncbi:MAG: nuclear transport factor 2 family protein [Novosphingobium sp.]|nr:nuclear transport factor 2 family protein [Novosphingobium sp.]